MIGLEDRQPLIQHIETAHTAGARLHSACTVAGISLRIIDFLESLFKTAKYRQEFPGHGFADLEVVRAWGHDFVRWHDGEHRHSGAGKDHTILAAHHQVYLRARERNPARRSGNTRNWSPISAVTLNP